MEKTVCELFAGVGGFRCGLNKVTLVENNTIENGNWNFVWANQWEPSTKTQPAFECYNEHFGKSQNHVNEDIATVDKSIIPTHSLLVGGFPCQDYSVARSLSNEKGIEGKKGVLWWQIVEVIEEKQPPFILLENVDRLLRSPSTQRGRDFGVMLRTLYENGYDVEWRVINAADYGFPQKRRRVFIFAYNKTTKYYSKMNKLDYDTIIYKEGLFAKTFPIVLNLKKDQQTTLFSEERKLKSMDEFNNTLITKEKYEDIVKISDTFNFHFFNSGLMTNGKIYTYKVKPELKPPTNLEDIIEKDDVDEKYFLEGEKLEKMKYLKGSKKIPRKKPNGEEYTYSEGSIAFPDYYNKPARTMLTSESSMNRSTHVIEDYKTKKLRVLTPVEAERIQMFPDNWTKIKDKSMTDKRRYFMMGNALVVGIVEKLGENIEKIIENE